MKYIHDIWSNSPFFKHQDYTADIINKKMASKSIQPISQPLSYGVVYWIHILVTLHTMQTIFYLLSQIKSVTAATATTNTHKLARFFRILIPRIYETWAYLQSNTVLIKAKPHPQESSSSLCFQNMHILVNFPAGECKSLSYISAL